jgi:hypothetical protein
MTATGRDNRVGTAMAIGLLLAALARVAAAAEARLEIDPAYRLGDLARSAEPALTIDRHDGVYLVDASAVLDADPTRLLAASLAYDRYARMGMPNVRDSRVVAVEGDGTRRFVWASMTGLGQASKHYLAVHVREHLEPAGAAGVRWELAPTRPSWPLSCLFTKQHYVVDIPAGAALGWLSFELFRALA